MDAFEASGLWNVLLGREKGKNEKEKRETDEISWENDRNEPNLGFKEHGWPIYYKYTVIFSRALTCNVKMSPKLIVLLHPTEPFAILEPQKLSTDISELHKTHLGIYELRVFLSVKHSVMWASNFGL